MLRSEPRLTPEIQDDLDRLDAVLHADRGGTPTTSDDLDTELLALVSAVRTTRPELDVGTKMRLEERVQAAKAAPEPRARPRITADRRWRAGLALAAVVAVAVPAGSVLSGDRGSDDEGTAVFASQTSGREGERLEQLSGTTRESSGSAAGDTEGELRSGTDTLPDSASGSSSAGGTTSADEPDLSALSPSSGTVERQSSEASPSATARRLTVPPSPATEQAPLDADREVVRDVTQTVRITPRDVARSAERVTTIVQDAGGYLGSSEVRERGPRAGGTFQVVVPTGRLDATVAALSKIGRPVRLERSSSDVTDQAVSLDDQLGDLRADRAAARLALAKAVSETRRAARRRELNLLSSRIARLQGQRDELRRQTATSRIDLRLTTSKAAEDETAPAVDDGSWGIGDAWRDAGRVLEVGGGVTLVGGVVVVPLVALLALGLLLRRRVAARRRQDVIDAA